MHLVRALRHLPLALIFSCGGAQLGSGSPPELGCPEGATLDRGGLCQCRSDRVSLFGACLSPARAVELCARRGAVLERRDGSPASCVPLRCGPDAIADETVGRCVGPGELRALAGKAHVLVESNEMVGCADGRRLRVAWGLPFCTTKDEPCGNTEVLRGEVCAPLPLCGAGYVLEPGTSKCVRLATPGRSVPTFDVATWARSAIGADGGEGARALCGALSRDSNGFEALTIAKWFVGVELRFPMGEISSVQVQVNAVGEDGTARAPSWLQTSATRAIGALVEPLRAMGGTANAAVVDTRVWCAVRHGAPPIALPLQAPASP